MEHLRRRSVLQMYFFGMLTLTIKTAPFQLCERERRITMWACRRKMETSRGQRTYFNMQNVRGDVTALTVY